MKRKNDDCASEETPKKAKKDEKLDINKQAIVYVTDTPECQMRKRRPLGKTSQTSSENSDPNCCDIDIKNSPCRDNAIIEECQETGKLDDDDVFFNDDDDEFDDIEFDDLILNEMDKSFHEFSKYLRLEVTDVTEENNVKLIKCVSKDCNITIKACGEWFYCDVNKGNNVHVLCTGNQKHEIELGNDNNSMLIIHPDILISPTTISSSVRCLRQAVLSEVFKPTVGYSSNEVMLIGTINHALFDAAVRHNSFEIEYLRKTLDDILIGDEIIASLMCIGTDKDQISQKIIPYINLISTWGRKFCKEKSAIVSYGSCKGEESTRIEKIIDIEENIWSPKYGVKGKVDATVRIHTPTGSRLAPIEVKSGLSKSSLGSIDHRAQVILYTMMLEERYKETVDSGLLYYIRGQQTIGVPSSGVERRALMIKRNEVAGAIHDILFKEQMKFPELVSDKMACKWCNHQLSCSLVYKSFEKKAEDSHPYKEMLVNNTNNLSELDLDYFDQFSKLCIQEAQMSSKSSKMPWNSSSPRYSALSLTSVISDHGFTHQFSFTQQINVQSSFIKSGDYVILSRDDGSAYNVAAGFVTELQSSNIKIYIRDVDLRESPHHRTGPAYQLTKHTSLSSLHTSLGNITSLMNSEERSLRWRKLIIEKSKPKFTNTLFSYTQEAKFSAECNPDTLLLSLNTEQRYAVEKSLATEDYLCILGMPGTGKTTTISCLIQLLVARGYSVLLTAYTHSAVDNLLMKLPESVDCVRLGAPGRVHPAVAHRTSHVLTSHLTDPKQLREFYDTKSVIATTCLGMGHSCFEFRRFDYCIVDEASQITQPICLGPLLHSDRCILVGDHHQLPPLVQSKAAKDNGLDVSLFKRLTEAHPDTGVCELGIQYRMCSDIMLLSNTLTYSNKLKCANEGVARSVLNVEIGSLPQDIPSFLRRCLSSSVKVVFLDTSELGEVAYETQNNKSVCNTHEALLVQYLCTQFTAAKVPEQDLGVLSPYNGQLELLQDKISGQIELLTADRYQGRDKPCILLSFVKSNAQNTIGNLLRDRHRLNVAVTRAKSKLIMVGNRRTLTTDPLFQQLFGVLGGKNWVVKLKSEDMRFYV